MNRARPAQLPTRRVYHFSATRTDGRGTMRDRLGGKGATLADLARARLPVPPGFTVPTDVCAAFQKSGRLPDGLTDEMARAIQTLERRTARRFGDPGRPLLVSVRSGAAVSMPGMMETILNVGLNDAVVGGLVGRGQAAFAFDSYRRLIAMVGAAVDGVDATAFDDLLFDARRAAGVSSDADLSAAQWEAVARATLGVYETETGRPFPQDPHEQLARATEAVFKSWSGRRAERYRALNHITGLAGTAVTVQAMVFGNAGPDSATGVGFTRDPSTGRRVFYGEFLVNAQGEDLVAGVRTPLNCGVSFAKWNRTAWRELRALSRTLETRYRDVQDFEFTIERGRLFLLQTRTAQRTAAAAVRIAVDLAKEGIIDRATAVARVDAATLAKLRPTVFDSKRTPPPIATGLAASPGAAVGRLAFTADDAERRAAAGERVILVRPETYPDDLGGFHAAAGVLTSTGGNTSHAAVVARGMNRTCVVGAGALQIDTTAERLTIKAGRKLHVFGPGDVISIDGSTGHVYAGDVPTVIPRPTGALRTFLAWQSAHAPRK